MAKPHIESLPQIAQEALKMFESVVVDLVSKNPKMAHEDKLASMIDGLDAFKGRAHEMQAAADPKQVSAQTVGDMSKGKGGATLA